MSQEQRLSDLGHFLRDRRGRVSPTEAGLPPTARRRVRGLRREEVAMLAGIGVSWYTALENGTASGVSITTLQAIANVLRLSDSERHYVTALATDSGEIENETPGPLIVEAMSALAVPAYISTASWNVPNCNTAFRLVWGLRESEVPFNAIERLFLHPASRKLHADRFIPNITPVISMLRSAIGRRPTATSLQRLRDKLIADEALLQIWNDYEITSPWKSTSFSIDSAIGTFNYRTLDLPVPGALHGLTVQLPDAPSRARLDRALSALSTL